MSLDVTNSFTAGEAIVASQMNTNFTDVENYVNNSMPALGTANTFTGTNIFNAAVTTNSTLTCNGNLTVQDGDTFTFNGVGLTAIQTSSEALADNDTSIMTAAHIIDEFVQSGTDGGTTIYVSSSEPSSGLKTNDIWLDTSS